MQKRLRNYMIISLATLVLGSGAIYSEAQEETAERLRKYKKDEKLIIAVVPEKNVFEQKKRYKNIANYLSENLNLDVRIKVLSDYSEICDAFLKREIGAAFLGSFSYVLTNARVALEPVARPVWANGVSTYTGYIFVRKDSGIKSVEDMKNKNLVLVHKATTAGYIFQLDYFQEHGIENVEEYFSEVYFSGTHEASVWAVYSGEADVGGAKNHIFNALSQKSPDFKKQMVVLAESPEMPSNGLVVRQELDPILKDRLKRLLLELDKTEEGEKILREFGAIKFIETVNEDYSSLYQMVKRTGLDIRTFLHKEGI